MCSDYLTADFDVRQLVYSGINVHYIHVLPHVMHSSDKSCKQGLSSARRKDSFEDIHSPTSVRITLKLACV